MPEATLDCACGKGKIVLTYCSPDHNWNPGKHWYEHKIDCVPCNANYRVEQREKEFYLVQINGNGETLIYTVT